jgi:hypothetical protein
MEQGGGGLGLPKGMKEEVFVQAVEASGYPLQIIVGAVLTERGYRLEEEWAFSDPDTEERRTLDIVASLPRPSDSVEVPNATIEAAHALLIECKRSTKPFVFFESVAPPRLTLHPTFLGLGSELLAPKGVQRHRGMPVVEFLGLGEDPYLSAPPIAASLTRAEPKGPDKILLSGEHAFNSLLMPLTKALTRFRREHRGNWPSRSSGSRRSHPTQLVTPLAVIDAPMVFAARPSEEEPYLKAITWVRLVVRNPVTWHQLEHGTVRRGGDFTMVDVVHRSFFATFLDELWEPFGERFYSRFASRSEELFGAAD